MNKYQTIQDIDEALHTAQINPKKIGVFDNKGELFINDENGNTLFAAYYGSHNACSDVCYLLGLDEPERV